jgi:predicted membrane GTPase involved in stress response
METGKVLAFSLGNFKIVECFYIGPNVEVYEGMVIGNTQKVMKWQ